MSGPPPPSLDRSASPAIGPAAASAALIEAVFAVAWFSWGTSESDTPTWLSAVGVIGAVAGVVLLVVSIVVVVRVRRGPVAARARDPETDRRYGRVVLVEAVALVVGVVVLLVAGAGDYVPVWVALVVGVHFVPLARIFGALRLQTLAVVVVAAAVAGLVVGLSTDTVPVTVVGPLTGLTLLAGSVAALAATRSA